MESGGTEPQIDEWSMIRRAKAGDAGAASALLGLYEGKKDWENAGIVAFLHGAHGNAVGYFEKGRFYEAAIRIAEHIGMDKKAEELKILLHDYRQRGGQDAMLGGYTYRAFDWGTAATDIMGLKPFDNIGACGGVQKEAYSHEENLKIIDAGHGPRPCKVADEDGNGRPVTVEAGRHLVGVDGREVIKFWSEAGGADDGTHAAVIDIPSLVAENGESYELVWEGLPKTEEEADELALALPQPEWIREKAELYIERAEDSIVTAVRKTLGDIYGMDFDLKKVTRRMSTMAGFDIPYFERPAMARGIVKLAAAMAYEQLAFENECFAGFEKADLLLDAATVPNHIQREAKYRFMETHPKAVELCEKCMTDRSALIEAAKREKARRFVAFEATLPPEVKEKINELKKVSKSIGMAIEHPFSTDNAVPVPVTVKVDGHYEVRYEQPKNWPIPTGNELRILLNREQELKQELAVLMKARGIKGTEWPVVEADSYMDFTETR